MSGRAIPTSVYQTVAAAMHEAVRTNAPKRTAQEWAAKYCARVGYVRSIASYEGLVGGFFDVSYDHPPEVLLVVKAGYKSMGKSIYVPPSAIKLAGFERGEFVRLDVKPGRIVIERIEK